jgi:hypothetical protein
MILDNEVMPDKQRDWPDNFKDLNGRYFLKRYFDMI